MKMDILAILMVAFALFAILMFILFYIFAKKYHNEKRISEDYNDLDNDEIVVDEDKIEEKKNIELIDIWIENKSYVFEANNYHLYVNQDVSVLVNDRTYRGVVTRSNYLDDITNYPQLPTKLVLKEEKDEVIPDIMVDIPSDTVESYEDEFVPKKKNS